MLSKITVAQKCSIDGSITLRQEIENEIVFDIFREFSTIKGINFNMEINAGNVIIENGKLEFDLSFVQSGREVDSALNNLFNQLAKLADGPVQLNVVDRSAKSSVPTKGGMLETIGDFFGGLVDILEMVGRALKF